MLRTGDPEFDRAFAQVFIAERLRMLWRLSTLRVVGCLIWFGIAVSLGAGPEGARWRTMTPYIAGYLTVALLSLGALIAFPSVRLRSRPLIPLLDMTCIFLALYAEMRHNPEPGLLAGLTVLVFVLLIVMCGMTLSRPVTLLAGGMAIGFAVPLFSRSGVDLRAWLPPWMILIGFGVGLALYQRARTLRLLSSAALVAMRRQQE